MAATRKRDALALSETQIRRLETVGAARHHRAANALRARILLRYARGENISEIARAEGVTRPTVQLCIDKTLCGGIETGICDLARPGRPSAVTVEDKAWVAHLAASSPSEYGYESETWTTEQLTAYVREHAVETGHFSLRGVGKATIRKIVKESPHALREALSFLDKRTLRFGRKTAYVFTVFKEIELLRGPGARMGFRRAGVPLCPEGRLDVRPGEAFTADLATYPGVDFLRVKECETGRFRTMGLGIGIDICDGRVIAQVSEKDRDGGFVDFLETAACHYPLNWTIGILLGNRFSLSRALMKELVPHPGRFEFIRVHKDDSWLNLVDVLLTGMTRTFLRSVRVKSKEEFIERLGEYVEDVNFSPLFPVHLPV